MGSCAFLGQDLILPQAAVDLEMTCHSAPTPTGVNHTPDSVCYNYQYTFFFLRVLLCSPDWPGAYYLDQCGLDLTGNNPASAS